MNKYINKLSIQEINDILSKCNLEAISFNNSETIKKTKSGIFIICVKTDSFLYKEILEWCNKRNSKGELIVSYIEKEHYKDFLLLQITDYSIKILNKHNLTPIFESEENKLLNIKLNSYFLKIMLNKFKNTDYKVKFCNYKN